MGDPVDAGQAAPGGAGFNAGDPRIQALGQFIAQQVVQSVLPQLGQIVQQNLSPAGRPVDVVRRDLATGQPYRQTTTTPQLLAELNDNIPLLIKAIHESNMLFMGSELVEEYGPRKKRRRE